jgi:hypothetical protein
MFLSMFAFDVFGEGHGLWGTIGALLLHLVPTYIVAIVLVIAWRWAWVGAILFFALAVVFLIWAFWVAVPPRGGALIVASPVVLIGILFLFNWKYRAQLRTR